MLDWGHTSFWSSCSWSSLRSGASEYQCILSLSVRVSQSVHRIVRCRNNILNLYISVIVFLRLYLLCGVFLCVCLWAGCI